MVQVPNSLSENDVVAKNTIEAIGLTYRVRSSINTTNPALYNKIAEQDPIPGTYVKPGTTVNVVLYQPEGAATVPNVIGLGQTPATTALTALGFSVTVNNITT